MKVESIKPHLQSYSITKKRLTTINHAFASAVAHHDSYDEKIIKEAIKLLGQNPNEHLSCVYCGESAETWDHVFGLVKGFKFSGYGHVIGNLLPCCKQCNSEKGNKHWEDFIKKKNNLDTDGENKIKLLKLYFAKNLTVRFGYEEIKDVCPDEIQKLDFIKNKIVNLMSEADTIAEKIRQKVKAHTLKIPSKAENGKRS